MEYISLLIIIIFFMLGIVGFNKIIVAPKKKHIILHDVYSWFIKFENIDSKHNITDRGNYLKELLLERRLIYLKIKNDKTLTHLFNQMKTSMNEEENNLFCNKARELKLDKNRVDNQK